MKLGLFIAHLILASSLYAGLAHCTVESTAGSEKTTATGNTENLTNSATDDPMITTLRTTNETTTAPTTTTTEPASSQSTPVVRSTSTATTTGKDTSTAEKPDHTSSLETTAQPTTKEAKKGITAGPLAAIVILSIILIAGIFTGIFLFMRRNDEGPCVGKKKKLESPQSSEPPNSASDRLKKFQAGLRSVPKPYSDPNTGMKFEGKSKILPPDTTITTTKVAMEEERTPALELTGMTSTTTAPTLTFDSHVSAYNISELDSGRGSHGWRNDSDVSE